ncbi:MAG: hypothetical protein WCF26_28605 [Candidatus Sulfotelmatobacter sp.]|jgi:hypothetical protein
MTKKQFDKALSVKPPNEKKVCAAYKKLSRYIDRDPELVGIMQAYDHALGVVMAATDGTMMDGTYSVLIPNTKLGREFRSDVREAIVKAYRAGLV